MKYGKAAGIVAITTDLLEVLVCADNEALLEASCELFNRALATSRCPEERALAQVKPLFKKGCPHDWKNYRLISLLSVVLPHDSVRRPIWQLIGYKWYPAAPMHPSHAIGTRGPLGD